MWAKWSLCVKGGGDCNIHLGVVGMGAGPNNLAIGREKCDHRYDGAMGMEADINFVLETTLA